MINITDKANCCGCTACANICPRRCITMTEDNEGFLYPNLDIKACINCRLCERVCPMLHKPAQHGILGIYAAQNISDEIRYTSSSGGVFTLLAEEILAQKGVVFGVEMTDSFVVRHTCVSQLGELKKLRGSKYVQSLIGENYKAVWALASTGTPMLFSGTPCQIAGLKGFLDTELDNLYTVDVVCHGVPSPKVYRKHLEETAAKAGEPVTLVKFRDKANGWINGRTIFATEHHDYGAPKRQEPYMRLFLNNITIRPTCGDCAFNNKRSLADITIADYWGINKQFPEFDDDKGTTLVIINTEKGAKLFEKLQSKMRVLETTFEKGAEVNQAVARSLPLHPMRDYFFENLDKKTLPEFVEELLE